MREIKPLQKRVDQLEADNSYLHQIIKSLENAIICIGRKLDNE